MRVRSTLLATTSLVALLFCAASAPQSREPECLVAAVDSDLYVRSSQLGAGTGNLPLPASSSFAIADEFVVQFAPDEASELRLINPGAQPGAVDLTVGSSGIESIDELASLGGVTSLRPLHPSADRARDLQRGLPDMSGWFVATVNIDAVPLAMSMAVFAADPQVLTVETIGLHPVAATPNDPSYASQWFLHQTSDKDIDAPEGWDVENGAPTSIVAVLDTGVRYFHKDLGGVGASYTNPSAADGNIWRNMAELNGAAGVDDDANGYIDDWVGWDFVSSAIATCWSGEDCTTADNDPRDFNGHGTHCSGIVAAMNNNGYAVASAGGGFGAGSNTTTGDGVKVMCMRIGHSANSGGQQVGYVRMDYAASAFYYAANNGAKIASCSWGSSNSGGIAAAASYFISAGGLIFKAAGNDGSQTADYLCSRTDVYSVVATDQADKKASFSTYGTWADISAPGVSILSTYHVYNAPSSDYVATLNGTSMATPLVASVAAVVWSKNPSWTRTQVWDAVRLNADPIDSLNPAYVGKMGSGRVNLHKALGGGAPPPPPPSTTRYLLVFSGSPSLPGVGAVPPEDIVQYDSVTGAWTTYFDGSDVGLSGKSIAAFSQFGPSALIVAFTASGSLTGMTGGPSGTNYTANDVMLFNSTTLGTTTSGSWSFLFDGSDVSLTSSSETIDALGVSVEGKLMISTTGTPSVTGLSGLADEDVLLFNATALGAATTGTFSWLIDGSDVGLSTSSNEDTDAVFTDSVGNYYFSTLGAFDVTGVSGTGYDIMKFVPTSLGSATAGTFSMQLQGSTLGVPTTANIVGMVIIP